jgi:hypothetical protein
MLADSSAPAEAFEAESRISSSLQICAMLLVSILAFSGYQTVRAGRPSDSPAGVYIYLRLRLPGHSSSFAQEA